MTRSDPEIRQVFRRFIPRVHEPFQAALRKSTARFTPACSCGYPLLKDDERCPRCERPTIWGDAA
jgi:hypothetical protein